MKGLARRVVAAALDGDVLVGRRAIDVASAPSSLDDVDDESRDRRGFEVTSTSRDGRRR